LLPKISGSLTLSALLRNFLQVYHLSITINIELIGRLDACLPEGGIDWFIKGLGNSNLRIMKTSLTYGLTHLAIAVQDVRRTKEFYHSVFGMETMYDQDGFIQMTTPGCHDILVFEEKKNPERGKSGGIAHFGFRLKEAKDIDEMVTRIFSAGGEVVDKGEFVKGSPYVFFKDPDGYEVEVWYELLPES
jgi:predicted enzyme related to lactoylglutathione lyase